MRHKICCILPIPLIALPTSLSCLLNINQLHLHQHPRVCSSLGRKTSVIITQSLSYCMQDCIHASGCDQVNAKTPTTNCSAVCYSHINNLFRLNIVLKTEIPLQIEYNLKRRSLCSKNLKKLSEVFYNNNKPTVIQHHRHVRK